MSQNIKSFFEENGYYVARGVYSAQEIAGLETDFDRIVEQLKQRGQADNARWPGERMAALGAADTELVHTHMVQIYSARWMDAFQHPNFLEVASAILGPDVILHHSKLFQKPPENGAPFPTHQDWNYFPTERDTMMAGIIHVSRATDEMGCVRVHPGSHRLGRVEGTMGRDASALLDQYPLETATIVEAEPGDVLFFHYFTLHGSMPNRSAHTRKTVLAQLHAGNDRVEDGNGHANARLPLCGWNSYAGRDEANELT